MRQEIEKKLDKYLSDMEKLPYGIAITKNDPQCTILKANSKYYEIIGHTKEQLEQYHNNQMIELLIDNVYPNIEEQIINEDYDVEFELRLRAFNGETRWIHDYAHYDKELDIFFATVTDISDKLLISGDKLSYEAFQTKHEVLSYVARYTFEHIVVTDAITDEVVYMNPMAMQLLDFKEESDWLGKTYVDIIFGSKEDVHPDYTIEAPEDDFVIREYYNRYHKKYAHVKAKTISIPNINKKMRLNIITDITAQKSLEYQLDLHATLHECIDSLFTTTATNKVAQEAYLDILNRLKVYYQASGAFFYRFKEGTNQIDEIYEKLDKGIKLKEHKLPMLMSDDEIKLMNALSNAKYNQMHEVLKEFNVDHKSYLDKEHLNYDVKTLACVTVKNAKGEILAYMGVVNSQMNYDNKELMKVLSRFICMFIEHHQDQEIKEEALALESVSKASIIEKCTKNFQSLDDSKDKINDSLNSLCLHYDADFAIVLSKNEEDELFTVSHAGGKFIPNMAKFIRQPQDAMDKWVEIFAKHSQFVTDSDLDEPIVKMILKEKFGINNFIVSPVQNGSGKLTGLLFVINYKYMNRAHFMVHVVAKNISDYLDRLQMQEYSKMEPATRLVNKVTTQNQISQLLETGVQGSLFVIDIDNFKHLNDTLGHQVGDQTLVDYAEIFKDVFRTTDVIGRVGGDEFMIFCPNLTNEAFIATKANQVLAQCNRVYEKNGITAEISASIGVCRVDERNKTFQPLYENADYALYISKRSGKNRYHIHSNTSFLEDSNAREDLRFYPNVVNMLKQAIEGHCFIVHYQPLYHVPTDTFTQAEALVRIIRKDGRVIYPNDFIQVADSTGLVVEMTYQILDQVCRDFRKLLDENPDTTLKAISVNIPYLQFTDPNMEDKFMKTLNKYNILPSQIKLEITERTVITDMDLMLKKMASMMEKGFDFELDDFGTDYSNLHICVTLPLNVIKLDRSLLLAASSTDSGKHFFGHILTGFHESGRRTIMEGVETEEQLQWAKDCKCEYIQGYYFSKPVGFHEFSRVINSKK